jgi:ADP-ribose pyrophosphatase
MKKWKKLKSKLVFKNPHFKVREDTVELPNKKTIKWTYWDSNDSAMVVAVTKERKLVFIRQHRYLVGKDVLEFPAGGVDEGESAHEAAQREFLEETGFRCSRLTPVGTFHETYGQLKKEIHLFFAKAHGRQQQKLDRGEKGFEDIQVELIDFDKAVEMALTNKILHTGAALAILLLKEKIERKEIAL